MLVLAKAAAMMETVVLTMDGKQAAATGAISNLTAGPLSVQRSYSRMFVACEEGTRMGGVQNGKAGRK